MPTTITLRSIKGSALTHNEVDDNFSNLKTTADAALPTASLGTGVATALAVNVGSAGAVVTNNAANTLTGLTQFNVGQNKRAWQLATGSTGEAVNFAQSVNTTANGDGTYNDVVRLGFNVGDGQTFLDSGKASMCFSLENKYLTGGRYWSEAHLAMYCTDASTHRPFNSIFPWDGGLGSSCGFNIDAFTLSDWAGTARFSFDPLGNRLGTTSGCLVGIGGAAQTARSLKVFAGITELVGGLILGDYVNVATGTTINLGTGQGYLHFANGGVQITNAGTTTNVPLTVKGMASQSGVLQDWRSSSASVATMSPAGVPSLCTGTAIPAGGTQDVGINLSSTAHFGMYFGSGAPSLSAAKGSLYLRSDGSATNDRAYINTDGGTTWTALTTVA